MKNILLRRFTLTCFLFLFVWIIESPISVAQVQESENGFIENPRPKAIQLQFRSVTDFTLNSQSELFGNSSANLEVNERKRIKVDLPVLLKPKDQLAIGLRVYQEEFEFVDIQQTEYPLYQNLEDKALWTFGLRGTYRRTMVMTAQKAVIAHEHSCNMLVSSS